MLAIKWRSGFAVALMFAGLGSDGHDVPARQQPLRVLVVTDMEGLSGVDDPRMVSTNPRDATYYAAGLDALHGDANAAIAGAFDAGATRVDVLDTHGGGANIVPARLDPRAHLISHDGHDIYFNVARRDAYDAVISIGMHDKPLSGAFMAHTLGAGLSPVLNGHTLTETELIGYEFGMVDVPVVFVSGDDHLQRDLLQAMPWIAYAVTKRAIAYDAAELLPASEVRQNIRREAARSLRSLRSMRPLKPSLPIRAGMLATFPQSLPPAGSPFSKLPDIEYRGDTVTFPARDYPEAYARIRALMGVATARGSQLMLRYVRGRPDGAAAFQAAADSVFDKLLPAFEAGRWRPQ